MFKTLVIVCGAIALYHHIIVLERRRILYAYLWNLHQRVESLENQEEEEDDDV